MISYLVMDVDGTLTDGKIYIGPNGETMKAFSVKDGYVFNYVLKPNSIVPVVITARNSDIVKRRCEELGISEVYQGQLDKLKKLESIIGKDNLSDCAYFGDDILDLKCMLPIKKDKGVVGCPADAVEEVKAIADYVCINKAGEGALREFAEWLVSSKYDKNELKEGINQSLQYLLGLDISNIKIGKKILVNDRLSFTVQKYLTRDEEECVLESHRKYVDIQIVVNGREAIDIVDTSKLTVKDQYNKENDVILWNPVELMARTIVNEGSYVILYPDNAHRGAVKVDGASEVIKIVGKYKIS